MLVNNKKWKTAEENITVFVIKGTRDNSIFSICQSDFEWHIGEIFVAEGEIYSGLYIREGAFHSSKNSGDLFADLANWWPNPKVYKAIIPKGTPYMEGVTENCSRLMNGKPGYISKLLKLIEEVKE